jgi:hypothetical protein
VATYIGLEALTTVGCTGKQILLTLGRLQILMNIKFAVTMSVMVMASTRLTSFQPVLIHLSMVWLSTVREIIHVMGHGLQKAMETREYYLSNFHRSPSLRGSLHY